MSDKNAGPGGSPSRLVEQGHGKLPMTQVPKGGFEPPRANVSCILPSLPRALVASPKALGQQSSQSKSPEPVLASGFCLSGASSGRWWRHYNTGPLR